MGATNETLMPQRQVFIGYMEGLFSIRLTNGESADGMTRHQAIEFIWEAPQLGEAESVEIEKEIHNIFERSRPDIRAYDVARQCWIEPQAADTKRL